MTRGLSFTTIVFAACLAGSFAYAADEQAAPTAEAPAAAPAPAPAQMPTGPAPPWATPEVLKAQLEIRLTEEQHQPFREIVGKFISDRTSMILMEIRKSPPNLDQDIRSRSHSLEMNMDKALKPVLTAEQWKPYEAYKKVLLKQLNKPPPS